MEASTLLQNVAATWNVQQSEEVKQNRRTPRSQLIQNFAHQDITQTALQKLQTMKQQPFEPVAQFAVKLNQLLLRADPAMSGKMKLLFFWPRIRHDLSRRVRDQGPTTFSHAIPFAQRIETSNTVDQQNFFTILEPTATSIENQSTPMDIDIQNVQATKRALPAQDDKGMPKCFYYNNYGHVKKYCRKWKATQQIQHSQILLSDMASLAELPGND